MQHDSETENMNQKQLPNQMPSKPKPDLPNRQPLGLLISSSDELMMNHSSNDQQLEAFEMLEGALREDASKEMEEAIVDFLV